MSKQPFLPFWFVRESGDEVSISNQESITTELLNNAIWIWIRYGLKKARSYYYSFIFHWCGAGKRNCYEQKRRPAVYINWR